jgi:hypothetical protein
MVAGRTTLDTSSYPRRVRRSNPVVGDLISDSVFSLACGRKVMGGQNCVQFISIERPAASQLIFTSHPLPWWLGSSNVFFSLMRSPGWARAFTAPTPKNRAARTTMRIVRSSPQMLLAVTCTVDRHFSTGQARSGDGKPARLAAAESLLRSGRAGT